MGISGRSGQHLARWGRGLGPECACVQEARRRRGLTAPSLFGRGSAGLGACRHHPGSDNPGWRAALDELGAWLPAYDMPYDGLWSATCWAFERTWLAEEKIAPGDGGACLWGGLLE